MANPNVIANHDKQHSHDDRHIDRLQRYESRAHPFPEGTQMAPQRSVRDLMRSGGAMADEALTRLHSMESMLQKLADKFENEEQEKLGISIFTLKQGIPGLDQAVIQFACPNDELWEITRIAVTGPNNGTVTVYQDSIADINLMQVIATPAAGFASQNIGSGVMFVRGGGLILFRENGAPPVGGTFSVNCQARRYQHRTTIKDTEVEVEDK